MRAAKSPLFVTTLIGTVGMFASAAWAQEPPATTPEPATQVEAPTQSSAPVPAPQPAVEQAAPTAPVEIPSRGATMDGVKAKFGAPSQEVAAVGDPPISRWEYPGYIVYFEYDKVLHTVVAR